MSSILTKENLTTRQQKAISYWTSPSKAKWYRGIKQACENKYNNSVHIVSSNHVIWFESLESLFQDYEDNTLQYTPIYRADIIENKTNNMLKNNEVFHNFCSQFKQGKVFEFESRLCSFSACKEIAKDIMTKSDKYSSSYTPTVLYILEERHSKYLYIADCTVMYREKEILNYNANPFIVTYVNILDNNCIELFINEIID